MRLGPYSMMDIFAGGGDVFTYRQYALGLAVMRMASIITSGLPTLDKEQKYKACLMLFWQRNDNLNLLSVGTEVIHRKRSLPTADEYVKPYDQT
jgi:hypothetical protein